MPESLLLLAQNEIVPFHSYRRDLLDEVLNWALGEDRAIELRLQAGEGGTGKTRLALAACQESEDKHTWSGGLLLRSENVKAEFLKLLREGRNWFVVVDYAETRTGDVIALTQAALKTPGKGKLRLLLLGRDGGDCWDRLAEAPRILPRRDPP